MEDEDDLFDLHDDGEEENEEGEGGEGGAIDQQGLSAAAWSTREDGTMGHDPYNPDDWGMPNASDDENG